MRRQHRRGANALEFALIMPVLVFLVFSVFELSYYFNRYMVVSGAARDAARKAAMAPDNDDAEDIAEEIATAYIDKLYGQADVDVDTTVLGTPPTRTIQVTVSTPYTSIVGGYIPVPIEVKATFSLRMEDQPKFMERRVH